MRSALILTRSQYVVDGPRQGIPPGLRLIASPGVNAACVQFDNEETRVVKRRMLPNGRMNVFNKDVKFAGRKACVISQAKPIAVYESQAAAVRSCSRSPSGGLRVPGRC